jgi:hypothetical protein
VVTALDRNYNESAMSEVLLISPPATPILASPTNGTIADTAQATLSWYYPADATSYQLQVALDSTFATQLVVNGIGLVDTFNVVAELQGQQTYYWRVSASNASGTGAFSSIGNFSTGFPAATLLVSPLNNVRDVVTDPTLVWRTALGASLYRLQVGINSLFDSASLVIDVSGIVDTSYAVSQLQPNTFHFWRVRGENEIGVGEWSAIWRFKTIDVTAVAEAPGVPAKYELYQNYPNPFNPITTIAFSLPKLGTAQLVIYDLLGREVMILVDGLTPAGHHEVYFDASALPSGVYYYRLNFEGRVLTKKMTVLK